MSPITPSDPIHDSQPSLVSRLSSVSGRVKWTIAVLLMIAVSFGASAVWYYVLDNDPYLGPESGMALEMEPNSEGGGFMVGAVYYPGSTTYGDEIIGEISWPVYMKLTKAQRKTLRISCFNIDDKLIGETRPKLSSGTVYVTQYAPVPIRFRLPQQHLVHHCELYSDTGSLLASSPVSS